MLSTQPHIEEEGELRKLLLPRKNSPVHNEDFLSDSNSLFDFKFPESSGNVTPQVEPVFFNLTKEVEPTDNILQTP